MIRVFYGMSGAFKGTTIQHFKNLDPGSKVLSSKNKLWKGFESNLFPGMIEKSHLNLALLHLCNLSTIDGSFAGNILIERGVTDPIFYQVMDCPNLLRNPSWIEKAVQEELKLLPEEPKKILLIQKDRDFIENTVLSEPTRREIFENADIYLEKQDLYVNFTKRFNKISEIVEIDCAAKFLEELDKKNY